MQPDDDYVPDPGDVYGLDDPRNAISLKGKALVPGETLINPDKPQPVTRVIHHPRSHPAMNVDSLPDAWKPKPKHDVTPEEVEQRIAKLPRQDTEDAPTLYAFYGNFGVAEAVRSSMEALCAELVRAQFALREQKVTEERLKQLARSHPLYLELLTEQVLGKKSWHDECKAHGEVLK